MGCGGAERLAVEVGDWAGGWSGEAGDWIGEVGDLVAEEAGDIAEEATAWGGAGDWAAHRFLRSLLPLTALVWNGCETGPGAVVDNFASEACC